MGSKNPNSMNTMTSPLAVASVSAHPRRAPAHRSVSLLHSPRQTLHHPIPPLDRSSPDPGATDSPTSLQPLGGKHNSGESSNAEQWFERSNNAVNASGVTFANHDPPFFLRNPSSAETPPNALQHGFSGGDRARSLPLRAGLLQLGTDGDSTEDFRGVIDDLTVENKRLKRRLRKYEKLHDAHLKDEKLFEVRIHGLPANKKRELEEMLRKFASTLGTSEADVFPTNGYASLMPMMKHGKTESSSASLQNTDSAYASMSASGHVAYAQPGNDFMDKTPTTYLANRRRNIQTYLHDIPAGLLPQSSPASMSEGAMKKLVVRKMEQLFAGKGANTNGQQHSLQQQEVSQSAAQTDRSAMEAAGQRADPEGMREAHIMDHETEDPMSSMCDVHKQTFDERSAPQQRKTEEVRRQDFAESPPDSENVEQRPTRPLDLDPQRAQVPDDNIRYMRHLGFSPYNPGASESPQDDHGWIYLNFLMNMAQLHTINVTPDFVRKALTDVSRKFEISDDGRKIRWRGTNALAHTSSEGDDSPNDVGDSVERFQSPHKRVKLVHSAGARSNVLPKREHTSVTFRRSESSKFVYTPLFQRKNSLEDNDNSSSEEDNESVSSPHHGPVAGVSTAVTSLGIRTSSGLPRAAPAKKRRKRDDGPIIFYNNARFCTDLSGDTDSCGAYNAPLYQPATRTPIGRLSKLEPNCETRGPLTNAIELPEPMNFDDDSLSEAVDISFSSPPPTRKCKASERDAVDFEVSGIGGIWPSDNFAVSIHARHARFDPRQAEYATSNAMLVPKSSPSRLAKILRGIKSRKKQSIAVQTEVLEYHIRRLPPSELPPALGYFGEESPGDTASDMDDGDMSEILESPCAFHPETAPQPVAIPYASSNENEDSEEQEDEDEDSDGEVDFLAAARQLDPIAVAKQEREYDAIMAERLAEEIPAGSSAATAGGGSGFASPVAARKMSLEAYECAVREARAAHAAVSAAPRDDSMDDGTSDNEDEDRASVDSIRS